MHVSNGFGYKITGRGVSIVAAEDFESYIVAIPSTLLRTKDLKFKGLEKIKGDEDTKVLSEVVMQYCMANQGTNDFDSALDPLVLDFCRANPKRQSGIYPADPSMGRIMLFGNVMAV